MPRAIALPQISGGTGAPPAAGTSRLSEGRSTPAEVVAWALQRFTGQRIVATTGFGMEGCVLIDLLAQAGFTGRVLYLDTDFLFDSTYALRDRLRERYPALQLERVATSVSPDEQTRDYGPQLWRFNPDLCCELRKVRPLRAALRDEDVWITAIRRDQSAARAEARFAEWDHRHDLLKVAPLAYWSRRQVWEYVQRAGLPYNPLHEQGYPSIGCTHCTRAVPGLKVDEYSRVGRWADTDKTECGLHAVDHADGSGI